MKATKFEKHRRAFNELPIKKRYEVIQKDCRTLVYKGETERLICYVYMLGDYFVEIWRNRNTWSLHDVYMPTLQEVVDQHLTFINLHEWLKQ